MKWYYQRLHTELGIRKRYIRKRDKEIRTYKSIAFRSSSGFVSDDNSLQDLTKLLKILLHGLLLSLPGQASNKDLSVCGVTKLACQINWSHVELCGSREAMETVKSSLLLWWLILKSYYPLARVRWAMTKLPTVILCFCQTMSV